MFNVGSIIRTVLQDNDHIKVVDSSNENPLVQDTTSFIAQITSQLHGDTDLIRDQIHPFASTSKPLDLVSFHCLLQDTSYPPEVYLPGDVEVNIREDVDWNQLKERWVGWGVEIPGEQPWSTRKSRTLAADLEAHCGINETITLPPEVHDKFPLPQQYGRFLGALIKVYGEVSYKPATTHRFVGILSTSPLPTPVSSGYDPDETVIMVPTIHVLDIQSPTADDEGVSSQVRGQFIAYLSTAFSPPDKVAATYLLLSLLSSPTIRPTAMPPLGTICVNLLGSSPTTLSELKAILSSVVCRVVTLPLSLPFLHSARFSPYSEDSASLHPGVLQLAPDTLLLIEEDAMGSGGELKEHAVQNLRTLMECVTNQTLRYHYPYMDDLKMDCSVKAIIFSEGKSLLPVDVHVPVAFAQVSPTTKPNDEDLVNYRRYLATHSMPSHVAKLVIPEEVATLIQEEFVQNRKTGSDPARSEAKLKRCMKVARILALSYSTATLSAEVWEEAVRLDSEVEERLEQRDKARMERNFGQLAS